MRLAIFAVLSAAALCGQSVFPPPASGGSSGTGNVTASGTPAANQSALWTDATHVKGISQGVFNVRMYGAVPDGSTDNATAIVSAFTASNAMTTGIPTVYFDCDTSSTTCQYNYGGSGTSPIHPTIATTVQCAPGVYLNYTGTAHALDLGSSGRSTPDEYPYTVQGCAFTGAASATQGIYVNAYITNTKFIDNSFLNFGNRTGFDWSFAGNNWESLVQGNSIFDNDGATRNIMDGHNTAVNSIRIIGNNVECYNAGSACSLVNGGVGFWVGAQAKFLGNVIQYHYPLIRLANSAVYSSDRPTIIGNHFEGNSGATVPAITYGDPGGTGGVQIGCMEFSGNTMYYPAATGTPLIGPETPASSTYALSNCVFQNNDWTPPSSGTFYVNTNGGSSNVWGRNQGGGQNITASNTSPAVFDINSRNQFVSLAQQSNGNTLPGQLAIFQSNGQDTTAGNLHNVAATLACLDSSGSGNSQSCTTTPHFDISGGAVVPVAGDAIIYESTTANTGALTIDVNSMGAKPVRKNQGTAVLGANDLRAGVYVPLVYDGTYWEINTVGNSSAAPTIANTSSPLKGDSAGNAVAATASDIVALFSTCSGTQYLGADGACHTPTAAQYPTMVAVVDRTAQAANIAATTLYSVPSGSAGMYRVSCYVVLTQVATTSSTVPTCTINWTDSETSVSSGMTRDLSASFSSNVLGRNNETFTTSPGLMILNAAQSTNIQYATNSYASSGATAMQYSVHIKLEYLGP